MATKTADIRIYTTSGIHTRKGIEQLCIRSVKEPELRSEFSLGYMIGMFEEETLEQLQSDIDAYYEYNHNNSSNNGRSNDSYNSNDRRWGGAYHSSLHRKLDELATRLNVNIKVFIGHIDVCTDFLDAIAHEFPLHEPTLILLIGCLGTQYAKQANQKEEWKAQQCAVLAFDNLIHIYDNKIYGCEVSHKSLPNMMCEYDGVEKDYEKLVENITNDTSYILDEYDVHQASYDYDNELVKCCNAKLDRFSSVFLKNLNNSIHK